jgi:CheY-like chemotaxis protein
MMDEKVMVSTTRTAMLPRFVETSQAVVSSAIAMLTHPSADVAANIAADLHMLGGEASMLNLPAVAKVAWEGENAAMQLAGDTKEGLVSCLRALRRLGYLLQKCGKDEVPPLGTEAKPAVVCRLLIVDDSPVSAAALAAVFETHSYDVRIATSWQEAKVSMDFFMPKVLITDVHMPDIDVIELCRAFRLSAQGRHVAVVLVSGRSETELRDRLDSIQADLFVPKMEGAAAVVTRVSSLVQGLSE